MCEKLGNYLDKLITKNEVIYMNEGKTKGKRKLSRNYIAKEVLGVSNTWFSGVVNGENEPSDEILIKLGNYFELDERYLFYISGRIHPQDLESFKEMYLENLKGRFSKGEKL
ncbi:helix-turn-helix transcriptional regulator [Metasolibacillus sp. FSL H7-0170]|uniref:helix-turn-helix domain-containing protein n=1 Tax=Metasolibacillus sp. FSL H7-0170 TaxID=2921431 RepID=UPI0031592CFA